MLKGGSRMGNSLVSFDLGDAEQRQRRVDLLDELAERFGLTNSGLLRKIADGELTLEPVEMPTPAPTVGDRLVALAGTWDVTAEDIEAMERAIEEAFEQVDEAD